MKRKKTIYTSELNEKKGYNAFIWGHEDQLKVPEKDILVPRYIGLSKDKLKHIAKLFLAKVIVYLLKFLLELLLFTT